MKTKPLFKTLPLITLLITGCSGGASLSLRERLHNAFLDVIEEDESDLRPLVNLTREDSDVIWNASGDKVLLFTFHRYPSSYPEGQEITFT